MNVNVTECVHACIFNWPTGLNLCYVKDQFLKTKFEMTVIANLTYIPCCIIAIILRYIVKYSINCRHIETDYQLRSMIRWTMCS